MLRGVVPYVAYLTWCSGWNTYTTCHTLPGWVDSVGMLIDSYFDGTHEIVCLPISISTPVEIFGCILIAELACFHSPSCFTNRLYAKFCICHTYT